MASRRPSGPFDQLAEYFADRPRALLSLQIVPPLVFVFFFVFVPLASIFAWSFWTVENNRLVPGFSTSAYEEFLGIGGLPTWRLDIFLKTLRIAVTQTAIALVLGFAIAYFVGIKMRGSKYALPLLLLFAVPFLTSYLLRTLSWYIVLQSRGLINTVLQSIGATNGPLPGLLFSEFSVHVGLLSTYLPFMIFPIWLAMSRIDQTVLAASADLGGRPRDTLFRVVVPLALPGILIGSIFVFVGFFVLYILMPPLLLVAVSFEPSGIVRVNTGFSLRWYDKMINSRGLMDALFKSILLAFLTTAVTTLLALQAALGYRKARFKTLIIAIMILPIFLPGIIQGFSLSLLLTEFLGLQRSLWTELVGHVLWALPFAFLVILTSMSVVKRETVLAAMDLGAKDRKSTRLNSSHTVISYAVF